MYAVLKCAVALLTGYSWDQPQRSQHTEGSKGFNVETSRFPSVSVHWWMATFSVSLLLFGQKLQDNTEESVTRERVGSRLAVWRRWNKLIFGFQRYAALALPCSLMVKDSSFWLVITWSIKETHLCLIFFWLMLSQTDIKTRQSVPKNPPLKYVKCNKRNHLLHYDRL